jgi:hypothetical protein
VAAFQEISLQEFCMHFFYFQYNLIFLANNINFSQARVFSSPPCFQFTFFTPSKTRRRRQSGPRRYSDTSSSPGSSLRRRSNDWCVNGMPDSTPMATTLTASILSARTIPERVSFEQASYKRCFYLKESTSPLQMHFS